MSSSQPVRFERLIQGIVNLLVLTFLGLIGYWGHSTHWKLPDFSGISSPASASAADGSPGDEASPGAPGVQNEGNSFPNDLPVIEFRTAEAARNCGIETGVADQRSMDDLVSASGSVSYDQTRFAQLAVRTPGIVWRVERRMGEAVRRGDVLLIVDSAEVGQAKADLLEAVVVYRLKSQNLKRLRQVANSIPEREIRELEAASELSRVRQFNFAQKLANLGLPISPEEIESISTDELTNRLQFLGLPATLSTETSSASLIPLRAPFDGIVTACDVVQGELVDPSKPQVSIADVSRMWIDLDVRQEDAPKLRLGAVVHFQGDSDLSPVSGTLIWIGTEADPKTRTVQARASADNPRLNEEIDGEAARHLLHANVFGLAHILIRKNPATVVIPDSAMRWQWEINQEVVFVASADRRQFKPRVVSKGLVQDDYVQILDGLEAGEVIVTSGSRILSTELSDRLQKHTGDNAEAIRVFDKADAVSSAVD